MIVLEPFSHGQKTVFLFFVLTELTHMAIIKLKLKIVGGDTMAYINRAIEDILKNRFETSKSVAITGA